MEFNKADSASLNYRQQKAFLEQLEKQPNFVNAIKQDLQQPQPQLANMREVAFMSVIINRLNDFLSEQTEMLMAQATGQYKPSKEFEEGIISVVQTIGRVLDVWQRRISDEGLTKNLLSIFKLCQFNKTASAVMNLLTGTLFSHKVKQMFHVIRAFMEHWNSYNNRKYKLEQVPNNKSSDLVMLFTQNNKICHINAKRQDLLEMRKKGLAYFQIAGSLFNQQLNPSVFLALITKIRLVVCQKEEFPDLMECIIRSYQVFHMIQINMIRKEEGKSLVPDIFLLPPDYEHIFLEMLELFFHPQIETRNKCNILQTMKAIMEAQQTASEDLDVRLSVDVHANHVRNIISDLNAYLEGGQPKHLSIETVSNQEFIEAVLKLFRMGHSDIDDIIEVERSIAEKLAFHSAYADTEIANDACQLLLSTRQNQSQELQLIDKLIDEIGKKKTGNAPPRNLSILRRILGRQYDSFNAYDNNQRRDSSARIRYVVDSPLFSHLSSFLTEGPIKQGSNIMKILQLIETICSDMPLVTQKMKDIIFLILDVLVDPNNLPKDIKSITNIVSFLHHVSLKEGEVRQRVMTCGALQSVILIHSLDKFTKILSITGGASAGNLSHLFASISRFLNNIPRSNAGFYQGLIETANRILKEMAYFEIYFEKYLCRQTVEETILYENVTAKVNNLLRLIVKISNNLLGDCKQLHEYTEKLFKLKYLNVHNASENKWMTLNAKLVEDDRLEEVAQEISKLNTQIMKQLEGISMTELASTVKYSFFQLYELAHQQPMFSKRLRLDVNLNLMDRLINLAKTSNHKTQLSQRVDLYGLMHALNIVKIAEDGDYIKQILQQVHDPLDKKEMKTFVQQTLKNQAQRNSSNIMLLYTLKRMVNETSKIRKRFDLNLSIANHTSKQIALQAESDMLERDQVVKSKICVENIHLLLEASPIAIKNNSHFPMNFTLFCYLYSQNPQELFLMFLRNIGMAFLPTVVSNPIADSFYTVLKQDTLKRIISMVNSMISVEMEKEQADMHSEHEERASAVRYVIIQILNGLIKIIKKIGSFRPTLDETTTQLFRQIYALSVSGIASINFTRKWCISECNIEFPIDPNKSFNAVQYDLEVERLIQEVSEWICENIHTLNLYHYPAIRMICRQPMQYRRPFEQRRWLTIVHENICMIVISLGKKYLPEIDLGIRHPRKQEIDRNTQDTVDQFNICLATFIENIRLLTENNWFGPGQLVISSSQICNLLKLAQALLKQKCLAQSLDAMFKRILLLVQVYIAYENQRQNQQKNKQKEEEQEQKPKRRKIKRRMKNEQPVTVEIKRPIEIKRPKRKKKAKNAASNITTHLQSFIQQSLQTPDPILTSDNLQYLLLFLTENIKKSKKRKLFFNMQHIVPLIIQVKLVKIDANCIFCARKLSGLAVKMLSQNNLKLNVEAAIKRIFFEIQGRDPNKEVNKQVNKEGNKENNKEGKDGIFSLPLVLKQLKSLTSSFEENLIMSCLRHLCEFYKKDEIIKLTNKQLIQMDFDEADKIVLKFIDGDLSTMGTTGRKIKRKPSTKDQLAPEQLNKYLNYVPEPPTYALIRAMIEQMIGTIINFFDSKVSEKTVKNEYAFDFGTLGQVLQVLLKQSCLLIPFLAKYKCRKIINNCLSKCNPETKRLVQMLIRRDKREETAQVTFMSLLLRLFVTLTGKSFERLIFQLCLDNYVMYKGPKNSIQSIGTWIRTKVIEELAVGGCGWIRTFSYLSLLINLLDIKQFARQCLQQNTIQFLHNIFIQTRKNESIDFFYAHLPFILNPLTILHNYNLNFHVSKGKPSVVRGRLDLEQIKDQLLPKTFLKKSNFIENWIYQSNQEMFSGEYSRRVMLNRNEVQEQPQGFMIGADRDSDENELSSDSMQNSQEFAQIDWNDMEEEPSDSRVTSNLEQWTSQNQDLEHEVMQQVMQQFMQQAEEMQMQDEQMDVNDDIDGLSDQPSSMLVEQMYGEEEDHSHSTESMPSQDEEFFKQINVEMRLFNRDVRRLADDIGVYLELLIFAPAEIDPKNPLLLKVQSEELYGLWSAVCKWFEVYKGEGEKKSDKTLKSLALQFLEDKVTYDEATHIIHSRMRRRGARGEILRRMTASSVQVDMENRPEEAPILSSPALLPLESNVEQPLDAGAEYGQMAPQEMSMEEQEVQQQRMLQPEVFLAHLMGGDEVVEDEILEDESRLRQLLNRNGFNHEQFRLMPMDLQRDILNNLQMTNIQRNIQEQRRVLEQPIQQQNAEQPPQEQLQLVTHDRRRKLSQDYIKKIARDPRQILLKEKKEHRLYECEDDFIISLMTLFYQDQTTHGAFPFQLLRSLCAHPVNQNKFLSMFIIILSHPNLQQEKELHNESADVLPYTVFRQKNNQMGTDYKNMGFGMISLKILHTLYHLSKSSASAMLEDHHVQVPFLPSWYSIARKPFYIHLINLLQNPAFTESGMRDYLSDTIFNIVRHYCFKYIHEEQKADEQNQHRTQKKQFKLRLQERQIKLLCQLLSSAEHSQQLSMMFVLLSVDKENLKTLISTLNVMLDSLSVELRKDLHENPTQNAENRGKLGKILAIVYDVFQSQYITRVERQMEKTAVKNELLAAFKGLIECKSLQQLCRDWIEYMCQHTISPVQMASLTQILECFFIIYKITQHDQQQKNNRRNISALGQLNQVESKVDLPVGKQLSLDQLFKFLCQRGKSIINIILKQKIQDIRKACKKNSTSVFDDSMVYILSKNSGMIDYDNKRSLFKIQIKNRKSKLKNVRPIELVLNRQDVLAQSMNQIMARHGEQLFGKLHIQFQGEEGEDAGGLTRQWFSLLSKEMFNPNYAIFEPSSTGNTYQPSAKSAINKDHLVFFKFVGRIVGKAMHDGFLLEAFFTPAFYKHILGLPITYRDMEEQDYEFYKNMVWIAQNSVDDVFDLTFSYAFDDFGEVKVIDLKPDGRNIPVTDQNKMEYIQMLCYAKMAKAVEKQIQAFLEGFHELIPPKLVSLFDSKQLQLMISGLPTIDIQDLKSNTELVNYDKTDNVIVWLFEVLQGYDSNLRASFLQFVTGTSRLPPEGFKGLRGVNGPQRFNIHKDFDNMKLPRAHTCFNQLDLPNYPTKQILIDKLTVAITEGKQGFGML